MLARHETAFRRLANSKFRSRFHLSDADRLYIAKEGIDTIRRHAEDFTERNDVYVKVLHYNSDILPLRGSAYRTLLYYRRVRLYREV